MKLITGDEFTDEERSDAAKNVVSYLLDALRKILALAVDENCLQGKGGLTVSPLGNLICSWFCVFRETTSNVVSHVKNGSPNYARTGTCC